MQSIEQQADETWRRISNEIHRVRRYRRRKNAALMAGTIGFATWVLFVHPRPSPPPSWTFTVTPPQVTAEKETWAMLVMDGENIRLEAVGSEEMGAGQLPFGLEPVVTGTSLVENDADRFAYGFQ